MVATHMVNSRVDCTFECLSDTRCLSYNYEEGKMNDHRCELNDQNKVTKPGDLKSSPGFTYAGSFDSEVRLLKGPSHP